MPGGRAPPSAYGISAPRTPRPATFPDTLIVERSRRVAPASPVEAP